MRIILLTILALTLQTLPIHGLTPEEANHAEKIIRLSFEQNRLACTVLRQMKDALADSRIPDKVIENTCEDAYTLSFLRGPQRDTQPHFATGALKPLHIARYALSGVGSKTSRAFVQEMIGGISRMTAGQEYAKSCEPLLEALARYKKINTQSELLMQPALTAPPEAPVSSSLRTRISAIRRDASQFSEAATLARPALVDEISGSAGACDTDDCLTLEGDRASVRHEPVMRTDSFATLAH